MKKNLPFLAEQNDSKHVIQNIKKICTDSSSDELSVRKQTTNRTTDIMDPAFKLPFKYGWKRELVMRYNLVHYLNICNKLLFLSR